jgi:hypothetical protein
MLNSDTLNVIRQAVTQGEELSAEEEKFILQSMPGVGHHRIGWTLSEYYWFWPLPTGRTAVAIYAGDIALPIDRESVVVRTHAVRD